MIALAERLGAATIATLNKRHFGVVRPRHVESFTLVPGGCLSQHHPSLFFELFAVAFGFDFGCLTAARRSGRMLALNTLDSESGLYAFR